MAVINKDKVEKEKDRIKNHIRTILIEEREKAKYSQYKVAEALDVSQSFVAMLERGERDFTVKTLLMFSEFYNVELAVLLGIEKQEKE